MDCIICNTGMSYFFSKEFNSYNLKIVEYYKCDYCGFSSSKTHYELDKKEWEDLNKKFHKENNAKQDNPYNRNQRYFNQALMIGLMKKHSFFTKCNFLDWGSGIGSVSMLSEKLFDIKIYNYDKYIKPLINQIDTEKLIKGTFDLVINCGVFEHVTDRETLDEIESYVADEGAIAIHTLIPEKIPKDPDWMYLLPVHCSFHTNKSMEILMKQWGYICSVYNEQAKLWILFKKNVREIESQVLKLNEFVGWDFLKFKQGFMDYWK